MTHTSSKGYLHLALMEGLKKSTIYLTSTNTTTHEYTTTIPTLIPAPNDSHIISHLRKSSSSQLTIYVISMENYHSYAMLATINTPV